MEEKHIIVCGLVIVSIYFGIMIAELRSFDWSLKDKITALLSAVGAGVVLYLAALFILKIAVSL